jgi:polyisoprenoid-binding protein YceI
MKPVLFAAALLAAAPALAQTYEVDTRHSHMSWSIPHLGISTYRGKFARTAGKITLDRAAKTGTIEITVDPASQISGDERLDKHLASEDFFNVAKFPSITFRSSKVTFSGDNPTRIDGELTMLGVTRPVTLQVTLFRCIEHPRLKKEVCGADSTATIKRSEWGMKYGLPGLIDDVKLDLQVEAYRQ